MNYQGEEKVREDKRTKKVREKRKRRVCVCECACVWACDFERGGAEMGLRAMQMWQYELDSDRVK